MMMEWICDNLFDYDYEPVKSVNLSITKDMTMKAIKTVLNLALRQHTYNKKIVQEIIEWLEEKEYETLKNHGYPVNKRTLTFDDFQDWKRILGQCDLGYHETGKATIGLSKYLTLPNNENAIINVLAHEVLHGILPFEEIHGKVFKGAMAILNEELNLNIVVRGLHEGKVMEIPRKYEVYCPACKEVWAKYFRKGEVIKNISFIHCPKCGGKLKVHQNY